MTRRILALIPARSGSKGLRHKNIRKLAGVPLLVRAIRLAQASRRRGETWTIVVCTDSRAYGRMAQLAGAVVCPRPQRLAGDSARLSAVVRHVLDEQGDDFDAMVMLSAVTPLISVRDVRRGLRLYVKHGVSVAAVRPDPFGASWRFRCTAGVLQGAARRVGRRQEVPGVVLNGALYIAAPAWLRRHGQFVVPGLSRALLMPPERSVDIESAHDLRWADFLAKNGY